MQTTKPNQIHALTSLRFFAAFYVLIFHSGGPMLVSTGLLPSFAVNFLGNGYLCVPFFFILSGFILTFVYHDKLTTGSATARYAIARFARVYPVYLLSLVLMMPFVSSPSLSHALPQFFLLQSWIPLSLADGSLLANWNMQSWTLSVELLFYLLFPLLLWGFMRLSTASVFVVALAMCVLMIAFRLPEVRGPQNLLYDGLFYVPFVLLRVPEFVFGVALGIVYRRGVVPSMPGVLKFLMVATFVVLCSSLSPWVAPIVSVMFGAIIMLVPASLHGGLLAGFLKNKKMVLFGGASYALYLLQLPVHHIVGWLFEGSNYEFLGKVIYLPVMIIVSVVVFLFFEEKMRHLLRSMKIAPRQTA